MLTTDHRWTSAEERERLAGMGIQLEGRTRLYGLNLSRCLGDKFLKVRPAARPRFVFAIVSVAHRRSECLS